jgi:osmotically-inducible protein OsmY
MLRLDCEDLFSLLRQLPDFLQQISSALFGKGDYNANPQALIAGVWYKRRRSGTRRDIMQRHSLAGYTLLAVCAFSGSVRPASAQTSNQIEAEVREALSGERDLRDLVVTAAGTEVTLTGEVETFWSKSEAIRRTLDVDGVETLVSEIGIPHAENDEVLATEVAKVIQRYPHHTVFDYLDGSVNKGVVTLGGKVTPDRNKSDELFERVAKVPGVQDVQNDIHTMTPSRGDDNLRLAIARQIFRSIHFERFSLQSNPPFHIIVERSVVTLVGYVQGEIELRAMEQIARQTHGVLRVDNQLKTIS